MGHGILLESTVDLNSGRTVTGKTAYTQRTCEVGGTISSSAVTGDSQGPK